MTELKPCPVCGKQAVVVYQYDKYDDADYGWFCGCQSFRIGDGIHDLPMVSQSITSKDDAIERWNRKVDAYERNRNLTEKHN